MNSDGILEPMQEWKRSIDSCVNCSLLSYLHTVFSKLHEHKTPVGPQRYSSSARLRVSTICVCYIQGHLSKGMDASKRPHFAFEPELAWNAERRVRFWGT